MSLAALIQFIPMAAEAIEALLNKLLNNDGTRKLPSYLYFQ
jgi:ubiquinone biosynthesis protein UbiJ